MPLAVPSVEVADRTNSIRVGGPHGKGDAAPTRTRGQVRAELFADSFVSALAEQMKIDIAKD